VRRRFGQRETALRAEQRGNAFAHVGETHALAGTASRLETNAGIGDRDDEAIALAARLDAHAATLRARLEAMGDRVLDDRDQEAWREQLRAQLVRDIDCECEA
jgi:hypothetical protein